KPDRADRGGREIRDPKIETWRRERGYAIALDHAGGKQGPRNLVHPRRQLGIAQAHVTVHHGFGIWDRRRTGPNQIVDDAGAVHLGCSRTVRRECMIPWAIRQSAELCAPAALARHSSPNTPMNATSIQGKAIRIASAGHFFFAAI